MKKLYSLLSLVVILLTLSCSNDDAINADTQNPVDVYVAGAKDNHAVYWKNNQLISLSDNSVSFSTADSIIVKNNNIHIVGSAYNNGSYDKLYWKNGTLTNLTETYSTPDQAVFKITGMDVVGNDVYFVGYTKNPIITAEIYDLVYWKNGVKTIVQSNTNKICDSSIKVLNNDVYIMGTDDINYFPNGFFKNGVFTQIPNVYIKDFAINNNEIYIFGHSMFNLSDNYIYNISAGSQSVVNFPDNSQMTHLSFNNNNMYYSNNYQIYKNGSLLTEISNSESYFYDLEILDNNIYSIKYYNGIVFTQTVDINNITANTATDNEFFRSLSVVHN